MNVSPKWICHPQDGRETRLVPVFRRRFSVKSSLKSAVLHLTAHGLYETEINGKAVTRNRFTPGFTSYYYRIQVQKYDVTGLLQQGSNEWSTTVGDGWWRWNNNFGYVLALYGFLELNYTDGSRETIVTDGQFDVSTGPIIRTDLQKGEIYDACVIPSDWIPAVVCTEHTGGELIETQSVPVREMETFTGKALRDRAGNLVFDFGQNIAGYIRMKLRNTKRGQMIRIKHGEALTPDGLFSTANCDGGKQEFQEIRYICAGREEEAYTPHFAVFGFHYCLVEGLEDFNDVELTAVAVYSAMEETGKFTCSNPLLNRLVENARWSQKGNFLDVPVDCPTRERNTWTGDAMIYCRTAAWLMNVREFFDKWLRDQTIEQYASGKVGITFPSTSSIHHPEEVKRLQEQNPGLTVAGPDGNGHIGEDSVGWGDSSVWIPYQMYLMYGDISFLERQYDTAKRWIDYSLRCMKEKNPRYQKESWYQNGDGDYIYDTRFHYGEWNEPLPPEPEILKLFAEGGTPADYVAYMAQVGRPEVATAYTARSCHILAEMAGMLGKEGDAVYYGNLFEKIRTAYDRYLIAENGIIREGHQAPYIRALALNLVSEKKKPLVINQLKKELKAAGYHLNTGFLSTVYLLPVLCDLGLKDEAFQILEQTEAPGWLHPIILGATTMLENWDGMDTFRDSFNHYSFGAVCEFLFEYVAGIRPRFDGPGFQKFDLRPVIGGTLTWAKAEYKTTYGRIRSEWSLKNGELTYLCEVPDGTEAHLLLPDGQRHILQEGYYEFKAGL